MVGRDESSGTGVDPDDWFADVEPEPDDERQERTGGDGTGRPFAGRRLVALFLAAVVLIVIVVAALFVFGGGDSSTPTAATTTIAATPPATPPPATVPATPPPPPTTPAVVLPAGVLRPGATGDDVKNLQRALARAGHSPGAIDGDYGPETEQAVSAFQRSAGITADGHYGPETKKALEQAVNSG